MVLAVVGYTCEVLVLGIDSIRSIVRFTIHVNGAYVSMFLSCCRHSVPRSIPAMSDCADVIELPMTVYKYEYETKC